MAPNRLLLAVTHLFIATLAAVAAAQPTPRELLNSERIATVFGSYGITVLEQDDTVRVSSLSSATGEERICRTFAIVRYSDRIDPALSTEHAAIVAGGSIGAVFAAAGWEVRKTHLRYDVRTATPRLASLMHVALGTPLAMHIYALDVAKNNRTLEYAALVEIHHPDYLTSDDLAEIYGPADEGARPELVAALLATATAAAARSPSPQ
jgi:hypothetical protein